MTPQDRGRWILVQDNDPKHKAKKSTKLLDKMAPDRLPDWPSNSPDFNPIEDVWSLLDDGIKHKTIKSLHDLKKNLTKAWENLDMEKIRASIASLPKRFNECIERNGERTSY